VPSVLSVVLCFRRRRDKTLDVADALGKAIKMYR
jgi:hypothetical protein